MVKIKHWRVNFSVLTISYRTTIWCQPVYKWKKGWLAATCWSSKAHTRRSSSRAIFNYFQTFMRYFFILNYFSRYFWQYYLVFFSSDNLQSGWSNSPKRKFDILDWRIRRRCWCYFLKANKEKLWKKN